MLAINLSLESAKHRQAKEIGDLRRKLRESRLSLPPRAYRAIIAQVSSEEEEDVDEEEASSLVSDNPDVSKTTTADASRGKADEAYSRCCVLLETLLADAKHALTITPADLVPPEGRGSAKVLSPEEVRTWRRDSAVGSLAGDLSIISEGPSQAIDDDTEEGESFAFSAGSGLGLGLGDLSNGTVEHDDDDDGISEDEVEASLFINADDLALLPPRQSLTPPIIVSPPTSP